MALIYESMCVCACVRAMHRVEWADVCVCACGDHWWIQIPSMCLCSIPRESYSHTEFSENLLHCNGIHELMTLYCSDPDTLTYIM